MLRFVLVLVTVVACNSGPSGSGSAPSPVASGSGSGSGAGSSDPIEQALVELEQFRTKMCACKDKPCADRLHDEFKVWKRNLKTSTVERPNKAQDDRGNALDKEMKACRRAAENGGVPADADRLEAFLAKMGGYMAQMCACKVGDKACGVAVRKLVTDYADASAIELAGVKANADQDARARMINDDMKACESKL